MSHADADSVGTIIGTTCPTIHGHNPIIHMSKENYQLPKDPDFLWSNGRLVCRFGAWEMCVNGTACYPLIIFSSCLNGTFFGNGERANWLTEILFSVSFVYYENNSKLGCRSNWQLLRSAWRANSGEIEVKITGWSFSQDFFFWENFVRHWINFANEKFSMKRADATSRIFLIVGIAKLFNLFR